MINLLAIFYTLYAFMFFYSNKYGHSLLRYMYMKKNINVFLSVEIIFVILTSLIIFINQPLNWIITIQMLLHIAGIVWVVVDPDNYYEMIENSLNVDGANAENITVITLLTFAIMALYSKVIFTL